MDYIIPIIISTIIIFLRIKTDIFAKIIKLIHGILQKKKIMQIITRIILIITPSICFIFLLKISNLLVIEKIPETINDAKEEPYLLGIIDFLKDCVKYSPAFWLVMCFLLSQDQGNGKENSIEENKDKKLKRLLSNMEISALSNYITAIIFTIGIYVLSELNILEIKAIIFFKNYFSGNIVLDPENTLRIISIILLGLFYHFGINLITTNYMMSAIECYGEVFARKTKKYIIPGYKILSLIPIVNIFIIIRAVQRLKFLNNNR